ncbi:short chain dehydrogenase reductase family oxidoreductase [Drechmeria coniospora]|uniref:Short chain dehydrogenase reductase family oxidoreductase n=1 Tax=Drechmeria coniospora TaxID=98403 RepID=A0A151GKQ4_DRECN|nr:short chain dehydrogenase reductase family oxidoreductase [Drechmeria coniospora]KYK57669.1 short chain dehydrogenase reductase family oxidoreductase [Drechmeria coniospora]
MGDGTKMEDPLLRGAAFITGAASAKTHELGPGIGKYTALAFAKHGVSCLALADVNLDALNASVEALREQYPHVETLTLHMDVRKAEEVQLAVSQAVAKFGRLDIAVNNAGVGGKTLLTHELDEAEWQRVIDINLNGVYRCQKEELSVIKSQGDFGSRRGRGVIVNVASMYGLGCTQKPPNVHAAILGFTKADANAYAPDKIRINAICPGYVATPLTLCAPADSPIHEHVAQTPMQRMAMPEEVADSIVFLASPMSSFMHGAGLVVDGGFTSI